MTLYYLVIFATGAATLALEVLASRILTPYYGVSLYIWTAILAITLTFLAVGYYAGGWLARRVDGTGRRLCYFAAPSISALAIALACLAYPWLFPRLVNLPLALASTLAAAMLLAVPLIVLSAMNPLLIAIRPTAAGDAGAGRVFFVSTIGSVAGVIVTAFLVIPNVTNFRGLLLIAAVLASLTLAGAAAATGLAGGARRRLAAAGIAGLVAAVALFAAAPAYLAKDRDVIAGGYRFSLQAEYSSIFGNLKLVRFADAADADRYVTLFLNDGLVQNRLLPDGSSYSEYTYALQALAAAYAPAARTALVLGLGAGVVPRALAADGLAVEAVEINRDMPRAVAGLSGRADSWLTHIADARSFVRRCRRAYDIIVIDLFHGDGTPDYLLTAEFFADVRRCLSADGVAVMNAFAAQRDGANFRSLVATLAAAFPSVTVYGRPPVPGEGNLNTYLVALPAPREPVGIGLRDVPLDLREGLTAALRNGATVRPEPGALIMTDEYNIFAILNAADQMAFRRLLVRQLPPQMLVN